MASNEPPFLVRFFDPDIKARDNRDRSLEDIIAWSDTALEDSHNYIQFVFPLPEGSIFNNDAPIITPKVREAFLSSPRLQSSLRQVFSRILQFYGLTLDQSNEIVPGGNYATASMAWRKRFDHNHLRITRIIRSLRVLGLEREAAKFYAALMHYGEGGETGAKTKMYWKRAVERPLHLPPDEDDEEAEGVRWLRDVSSS